MAQKAEMTEEEFRKQIRDLLRVSSEKCTEPTAKEVYTQLSKDLPVISASEAQTLTRYWEALPLRSADLSLTRPYVEGIVHVASMAVSPRRHHNGHGLDVDMTDASQREGSELPSVDEDRKRTLLDLYDSGFLGLLEQICGAADRAVLLMTYCLPSFDKESTLVSDDATDVPLLDHCTSPIYGEEDDDNFEWLPLEAEQTTGSSLAPLQPMTAEHSVAEKLLDLCQHVRGDVLDGMTDNQWREREIHNRLLNIAGSIEKFVANSDTVQPELAKEALRLYYLAGSRLAQMGFEKPGDLALLVDALLTENPPNMPGHADRASTMLTILAASLHAPGRKKPSLSARSGYDAVAKRVVPHVAAALASAVAVLEQIEREGHTTASGDMEEVARTMAVAVDVVQTWTLDDWHPEMATQLLSSGIWRDMTMIGCYGEAQVTAQNVHTALVGAACRHKLLASYSLHVTEFRLIILGNNFAQQQRVAHTTWCVLAEQWPMAANSIEALFEQISVDRTVLTNQRETVAMLTATIHAARDLTQLLDNISVAWRCGAIQAPPNSNRQLQHVLTSGQEKVRETLAALDSSGMFNEECEKQTEPDMATHVQGVDEMQVKKEQLLPAACTALGALHRAVKSMSFLGSPVAFKAD